MEQESAVCENRAVTSEIKTKSDVSESEEQTMKTTLSIEGMMCGHCQATVEKALKGVPGVSEVVVSLEDKNAVVTAEESVSADALKAAVVDAGYEVTNIHMETESPLYASKMGNHLLKLSTVVCRPHR